MLISDRESESEGDWQGTGRACATLDDYWDAIAMLAQVGKLLGVEHSTDVTKGLLRLYQVRKFSDARFFIVAPANVEQRFRAEVEKDPFHQIKDRYTFKSYDNLKAFYRSAKNYHSQREAFLGM